MLLAIRERITGFIAWAIVLLISIPFMLWGVNEYFGVGDDRFAVKVDDREVSLREYDRLLSQNRQQLTRSFGGRIPDYFDADSMLRQQTLSQLINRELVLAALEEDRYRIPAQLIAQRITNEQRFRSDGQFDQELYAAELRARGLSREAYEQQQGRELASLQLQRGIQETAIVPRAELAEYAGLHYQKRDFEWVTLELDDFRDDDRAVSEEAIAEYYEAHKAQFQTPEKVRIDYVELSLEKLAAQVPVDDQLLRRLYEEALDTGRYRTEEVRSASHILLKVAPDAPEEEIEEARAEALALRERLLAGEDFAKLAEEFSEDPGSAAQGGSLGEVRPGAMVKPFEDALFSLEPGTVSEPVKTRFGFHLIKVDDVQPPQVQPFEEVRAELEQEYRRREAESVFYDRLDVLANEAFENSDSLAPAAGAIGAEVRQSEYFTRQQGEGIAQYPEVRETAFSESVLKEGRNSELIEVDSERVVVLRVADHQPSRQQTPEEAREDIVKTLRSQRAREALDEAAGRLQARAEQGDSLEALAGELGGDYQAVENAGRDYTQANRQIVQAVFGVPWTGELSVQRVSLMNGDVAVARLTGAENGDLDALEAEERNSFAERLVEARGQYDVQAFIEALKADAEVVINPDLQEEQEQ